MEPGKLGVATELRTVRITLHPNILVYWQLKSCNNVKTYVLQKPSKTPFLRNPPFWPKNPPKKGLFWWPDMNWKNSDFHQKTPFSATLKNPKKPSFLKKPQKTPFFWPFLGLFPKFPSGDPKKHRFWRLWTPPQNPKYRPFLGPF